MNIKEQIRRYILESLDDLNNKGDRVQLRHVYPDIIISTLNKKSSYSYIGGYGSLYKIETEQYQISGSMQYGIATVILLEDK